MLQFCLRETLEMQTANTKRKTFSSVSGPFFSLDLFIPVHNFVARQECESVISVAQWDEEHAVLKGTRASKVIITTQTFMVELLGKQFQEKGDF